jgi:hypothetical protein
MRISAVWIFRGLFAILLLGATLGLLGHMLDPNATTWQRWGTPGLFVVLSLAGTALAALIVAGAEWTRRHTRKS